MILEGDDHCRYVASRPPPRPCPSPGAWGEPSLSQPTKNCVLQFAVAVRCSTTVVPHIVARHFELHSYLWIWIPQRCFHLEQMRFSSISSIHTTTEPTLAWLFGLYFTRDISEDKWVPKHFLATNFAKHPAKKAKPPPKDAAQLIPVRSGEHVQELKLKWTRTRGGGGKKLRAWKKIAYPPTLQGLPAQKKLSRHNCSIWKIFYPGAKMEFFAPNFPLHIGMY